MNARAPQTQQNRAISSRDWSWSLWPLLPLYPYGRRRTLCREVVPETIWTFDQVQGIFYVVVPIRMTVVKLDGGGLLVYAPVAPTPECIRLVRELEAAHGKVAFIVLPTASGLEHKVFVSPFARHFPKARVFVAPHQWSYPLDLPLSWLGFPIGRTEVLPEDSRQAPFADTFDYTRVGPIGLGLGPFEEVAFFHRRSHTLLVTDTVLSVPEEPPAITQLDPYPMLFHARDCALDVVQDTPDTRRKGWWRIALFAFYFRPSAVGTVDLGQAFQAARQASDRSRKAYFGLFPFDWKPDWERSFHALRQDGRLVVAPILQQLILNRAPQEVLAWADRVASWEFQRIIPCHFDAPIAATPQQFREAFAFLEGRSPVLPPEDFEVMRELEAGLLKRGILPAPRA